MQEIVAPHVGPFHPLILSKLVKSVMGLFEFTSSALLSLTWG